jgi:hypothetical protein
VDGVALSLLIIKGMMTLCGTWDEKCVKFQETLVRGIDQKRNQIIAGTDSWYTMTGEKLESK